MASQGDSVASGVAVARGGAILGDADGATLDGTTRGAGGVSDVGR